MTSKDWFYLIFFIKVVLWTVAFTLFFTGHSLGWLPLGIGLVLYIPWIYLMIKIRKENG